MKDNRFFKTHMALRLIVDEMIRVNEDPAKDGCSENLLDLGKRVLDQNNELSKKNMENKQ